MNFPLKIARRYLFAKKSTTAINIISYIAVIGITVGTTALILVLSVFNGFEELLVGLFNQFNPDLKVIPAKGKTFDDDSSTIKQLLNIEDVLYVSRSLEEVAFFEYKSSQNFGILKGVDSVFTKVTGIDTTLVEGEFLLSSNERNFAVLGGGMRSKLAVNVDDFLTPVTVYMTKRKKVSALGKPFRQKFIYPAGTFRIQNEFDQEYVLTSLKFARELLNQNNAVSSYEMRLSPQADIKKVQKEVKKLLGDDFIVKNRYQQEESFLKLMNVEKWVSFMILSLMILLISFNLVGSLWMIVMEKKKDIAILKSMGAQDATVQNIFLNEGLLLTFFGLGVGFILALLIYFVQVNFGIVTIPTGFIIDAYPVKLKFLDFIAVGIVVGFIGFLASIMPAKMARKIPAMIIDN